MTTASTHISKLRAAKFAVIAGGLLILSTMAAIIISLYSGFAALDRPDVGGISKPHALADSMMLANTFRKVARVTYPVGGLLVLCGGGILLAERLRRKS